MSAKSEQGSVIFEFAIVLPILIVLLFGSIDLGKILIDYIKLSRIAYEGSRFAASLPGLEKNNITLDCTGHEGFGDLGGCRAFPPAHQQIATRIDKLALRYGLPIASLKRNISFAPNQKDVTISLQLTNRPSLFPAHFTNNILGSMSIRVTGPYLFPDKS